MRGQIVGREDELDQFARTLEAANNLALLIIEAEAGIGKSTVVDAFTRSRGISPVICRFGGTELGLQRIADAFGLDVEAATSHDANQSPLDTATVLRSQAIHSLTSQVVQAVQDLASQPQVIVFEDLHFATDQELELFESTVFALGDVELRSPALVVVTSRPLDPTSATGLCIDRVGRPRWATTHRLAPLAFDEVAQLLRHEQVEANPVSVVEPVLALTGGNALHVRALAAELRAGKELSTTQPGALSEAVSSWMNQLSENALSVLGAGAIFGSSFTDSELAAVANQSQEAVDQVIEEALAVDVLTDRGELLTFSHDLIHNELRSYVPRSQRPSLRTRCAEVAAHSASLSREQKALVTAHHLTAAGEAASPQARYDAMIAAAESAFNSFQWPAAATFYGDAFALESRVSRSDAELVRHQLQAGRSFEYAYANEQALELYRSVIANPSADVDTRFNAAFWAAHLEVTRPGTTAGGAVPSIDAVTTFLSPEADPNHRALALVLLAESAMSTGSVEDGSRYAQEALAASSSGVSDQVRARSEWAAGIGQMMQLTPDMGEHLLTQSRDHADSAGDVLVSCWTRNRLAHTAWVRGDIERARSLAQQGGEHAESLHVFGEMGYAACVEAGAAAASGDFRCAERIGKKAMRYFEHSQFSQIQYLAYPVQLWVHHLRGDNEAATAVLDDWSPHQPVGKPRFERLVGNQIQSDLRPWKAGRALTLMGAGMRLLDAEQLASSSGVEPDAIVEDLQRLIDLGVVLPSTWPSLPSRVCADLLLNDDRPEEAIPFARHAVDQARSFGLLPDLACSQLTATECFAKAGHTDDARRSIAEAMTLADRLGLQPALQLARPWASRLTTEARDPRLDSEFRVVLVTDVVDSTGVSVRDGDNAYIDAMDHHLALSRSAVESNNGHVFDTAGDSLLAWFSSTHEAEAAALSILMESTAASDQTGVRIGLASGYPFQRDDAVFGATVILAARICSAARPDSIFVSADLAQRSSRDFQDEGAHELKGFPGTPQLFSLG